MVIRSLIRTDGTSGRQDRAQLLLVGSVLIAAIIMGLVVVINTVLVTENVANGESLDRGRDAAQFDAQARRNVRSLVLRSNHEDRNTTAPALTENVHRNVSNYSRLLAEAYSIREPVWVNISYDNGSSDWGQRLVKASDGPFESAGGMDDWEPVGDHRRIGRFVLNLNVSETDTEKHYFNFTNTTGHHVNISLQAADSGTNSNILVNSPHQSGAAVCEPSSGRVLVDMLSGTAFTGQCEFEAPETVGLQGAYNLTVTNGSHGHGTFGIVTNDTVSPATGTYPDCQSHPQATCTAPVIWSANATVQYESAAIAYEQDHNVSVYP